MTYSKHIITPLGRMTAVVSGNAISSLSFFKEKESDAESDFGSVSHVTTEAEDLFNLLQLELDEYFSGARKTFSIPVMPEGTGFQKKVWSALMNIPYGERYTYLQLAKLLKQPEAVRAVAGANARNPVMILIPCHRINGSNGSLTGYAGGLPAKKFLLELESGRKSPRQLEMELF